jgi:hypothetical protein
MMKSAVRYAGKDLDAMKATAQAQKERSLEMFKSTLKEYQDRMFPFFFEQPMSILTPSRASEGSPHSLSSLCSV